MADEPDSLTLRYLRRIDEQVARLVEDVHGLKVPMTAVEEGLVGINRRPDRLEDRIDRIEKRLDLADTHL